MPHKTKTPIRNKDDYRKRLEDFRDELREKFNKLPTSCHFTGGVLKGLETAIRFLNEWDKNTLGEED